MVDRGMNSIVPDVTAFTVDLIFRTSRPVSSFLFFFLAQAVFGKGIYEAREYKFAIQINNSCISRYSDITTDSFDETISDDHAGIFQQQLGSNLDVGICESHNVTVLYSDTIIGGSLCDR